MRIGIIGTGAMGSFLAAHLAPQHDVTVLGTWNGAVDELNRVGVRLERDGEHFQTPVPATTDPATVSAVDTALIAVKGHQTERAARWAKQILKPQGLAVTLQNGIGNYEIVAQHVGAARAGVGVTMLGATLLGAGHVRHAGQGPTLLAATAITQTRMQTLCDVLNRAGIETQLTNDIAGLVWGKLVVNSAINALSAIYRVPNGSLVEHPETRALLSAAAQETAQVANALGIALPYADPVARTIQVATATAANKSSTLQDVLRGAPTELDRINGAVVREGKRLGVPTPVNEQLMRVMSNPHLANHAALPYLT
ncbi:MAG: 2-dehydropantoate 2-reductase [Anaerolineae bacterium]|nr:2-dehydropantoate 2-reductase [Anaerolineae bacterium]